MVLLYVLILFAGFFALVKGADIFVNGSSALARYFNVPGLIVGLTIVALGTSAPELAVSTLSALQGANEIALSNVTGSNIFNLLGVLGICSIIHPLPVEPMVLKRDFPFSIMTTALLLPVVCRSFLTGAVLFSGWKMDQIVGDISRLTGLIMVLFFVVYICFLIVEAKRNPEEDSEDKPSSIWKCVLLILVGLALIIAGGQAVVYGARNIARAAGMTETLIGLTIVAVGTSLPELVTSVVAARKGETGLAIGNVVGSNIFNILFILGISSFIHPVAVNFASVCDIAILLSVSILSFFFSFSSKRIARMEGMIMVAIYVGVIVFAVVR